MPPEMSPEIVSIIGVGIALLTVIAAFAGLLVTLLLRMDRRTTRNIESTNARIDRLTDEVRAITQAQIRTDHQVEVLTDQMKELAGR